MGKLWWWKRERECIEPLHPLHGRSLLRSLQRRALLRTAIAEERTEFTETNFPSLLIGDITMHPVLDAVERPCCWVAGHIGTSENRFFFQRRSISCAIQVVGNPNTETASLWKTPFNMLPVAQIVSPVTVQRAHGAHALRVDHVARVAVVPAQFPGWHFDTSIFLNYVNDLIDDTIFLINCIHEMFTSAASWTPSMYWRKCTQTVPLLLSAPCNESIIHLHQCHHLSGFAIELALIREVIIKVRWFLHRQSTIGKVPHSMSSFSSISSSSDPSSSTIPLVFSSRFRTISATPEM